MTPTDLQALLANILRANSFTCSTDDLGDLVITEFPNIRSALNVSLLARELAPYVERTVRTKP